jgi:hypothetical protein
MLLTYLKFLINNPEEQMHLKITNEYYTPTKTLYFITTVYMLLTSVVSDASI